MTELDPRAYDERRNFLTSLPGPFATDDEQGLTAELARLDAEAEQETEHDRAGHLRRRAWVCLHLAGLANPERATAAAYEQQARAAVTDWDEAENAATVESVTEVLAGEAARWLQVRDSDT